MPDPVKDLLGKMTEGLVGLSLDLRVIGYEVTLLRDWDTPTVRIHWQGEVPYFFKGDSPEEAMSKALPMIQEDLEGLKRQHQEMIEKADEFLRTMNPPKEGPPSALSRAASDEEIL